MSKRTQAEKLKRVMMWGTLQYEGPASKNKIVVSFTPNESGHVEYGIPPIKIECHSPFEVVDLVLFEYIEKRRPEKGKTPKKD